MIKVLIMDDLEKKVKDIKKVLIEGCGLKDKNINVASSISSGRQLLSDNNYDLLLLDLVIPQFDGEDPDSKGGLTFISEINSSVTMNTPTQIIGLTEHENKYNEKKSDFEHLLFSVILREQGSSDWINQLKARVNFAIRSKRAILDSLFRKEKFDMGIICALQEEFTQLIRAFGEDKWAPFEQKDYPYQFKEIAITTSSMSQIRVVAACAGRPGVVPTSILATTLYTKFHVDCIFMTGFAAGFQSDDLQLGDIVVAKSVQDYASGKIVEDKEGNIKLLKEIQQIQTSQALINKMQELISNEGTRSMLNSKVEKMNLKVNSRELYTPMIASTVCGPYVMASEEVVKQLKADDRKLKGLDMEGFGLYLTAHSLTKEALWIKGISDYANPQKADDYHRTCAFSSASLLYMFIKEYM